MTTREEWLALAEKCAKAEGPSIGLDLDIGLAAGVSVSLALPHTASLDAITGLVRSHWPMHSVSAYADDVAYATVFIRPAMPINSHKCATPALALCEAFCRAMAEKVK
jgi:hypothetical protein